MSLYEVEKVNRVFGRGQVRFTVNMSTLNQAELDDHRLYLDLARRLDTHAAEPREDLVEPRRQPGPA